MRPLIATINLSLDGFCDHTLGNPDAQIHDYYTQLLDTAGVILYGRKTYELMTFWQEILAHPSEKRSMNDFAAAINRLPKLVFSRSLQSQGAAALGWESAQLATRSLAEEIQTLKAQDGKPVLLGSPSMIAQATQLHLVDEYRLCLHPVIAGQGLTLFKDLTQQVPLRLRDTRTFEGGAVLLCYDTIQ